MNIVEDKLKEKRTNKTYNKTMKTHKVIAALNNNDENNEVFIGTYQECWDWKYDKGFGYKVMKMTEDEIKMYADLDKVMSTQI
jgi:hypothetical protein